MPTVTPICVAVAEASLAATSGLADAEVRDQRVPLVQQDVLRLDVAVDHVVAVGVVERIGHLRGDADRLLDRQRLLGDEPVPQRLSGHDRHDEIEEAVGLPRVVERQDVRVVEGGGQPDFAQEAVPAQRLREIVAEHLDRHLAVVLEVAREVHRGHAALAELALDAIAVGQGGGEAESVGHGHCPSNSPKLRRTKMSGRSMGTTTMKRHPSSEEVQVAPAL